MNDLASGISDDCAALRDDIKRELDLIHREFARQRLLIILTGVLTPFLAAFCRFVAAHP